MKTYRVFPSPFGWCIDADGRRVGPYREAQMAVQLVLAQAGLARSRGMETKLIVEDEDGAVRLEWTSQDGTTVFPMASQIAPRQAIGSGFSITV
jgi:hypothetical protein